jgi:hypothetical protein
MPVFNPFQPWTYQPPKPSRKAPIEGHPPIIGKPVAGPPLSESVIEEVLRQYREAMRHGELPIAFGSGGLAVIPKPTPAAPGQTTPQPLTPPAPPTRGTPPIETEVQPPTPPTPMTATPTMPATAQPAPLPFVIETELGMAPPPTIPNIPPHILLNLPELGLTPEEFARLLRRPRLVVPA